MFEALFEDTMLLIGLRGGRERGPRPQLAASPDTSQLLTTAVGGGRASPALREETMCLSYIIRGYS